MQLRDYQKDICKQVHIHLAKKNKCIVALAGGGGKSLIAAQLTQDFLNQNKHIVILTSFSALIPQLSKHLNAMQITHNIVKAGNQIHSSLAQVTLIMEQSFHEKTREKLNVKCDVLIKDEIHISTGKRFQDIIKHLEPKQEIGLSFTPINERGFIIDGYLKEDIITIGSMKELTEKGYLCPIKTYIPKWAEDVNYGNIKIVGADYSIRELDSEINTQQRIDLTIDAMNKMNAKKKQTLVYAVSIDHANRLHKSLKEDGYNSSIVHSGLTNTWNEINIKDFKNKKINCLISVMSLTIGFDAPCANLLVLLRPTKILRLYLQIAARVSRTYPGKEFSEILDLGQCTKNLGFYDEPIYLISRREENHKKKLESHMKTRIVETSGSNDEPTEVTRDLLNQQIEEINKHSVQASEMNMKDLITENQTTNSIFSLVITALELNFRIRSKEYSHKEVKELLHAIESFIEDFPEHRQRIIETYRLRFKNSIRESKDIMKITNFSKTLVNMYPYNKEEQHGT